MNDIDHPSTPGKLDARELGRRLDAAVDGPAPFRPDIVPVDGGHQSQVFLADGATGPVVLKVHDAAAVDRALLANRLGIAAALADIDRRVCRPLMIGDRFVVDLRRNSNVEHFVTCFEFAAGAAPDPGRARDAEAMGAALARLHQSMRRLAPVDVPAVATLCAFVADHHVRRA